MRILLTHHAPLDESDVGRLARAWAESLVAAGHDAKLLVVDANRPANDPLVADAIVCRANDPSADLPFDVPRFKAAAGGSTPGSVRFLDLSDQQLAIYRDTFRRRLDALVDAFDPHVIHAQHVWVLGQLALETGVPYVLNAWQEEFVACPLDVRYRRLADQAAANAGRILVTSPDAWRQAVDMFEIEPERVLVMDEAFRGQDPAAALVRMYQALLDERFGGAV